MRIKAPGRRSSEAARLAKDTTMTHLLKILPLLAALSAIECPETGAIPTAASGAGRLFV
jgi:hypothetical protein